VLLEDGVRVAEHCNNKVEDEDLENYHDEDDEGVVHVDFLGLLAAQVILSDTDVEDGEHRLLEIGEARNPVVEVEAADECKGEAETEVEDEEVAEVGCHLSDDLDQRADHFEVLDDFHQLEEEGDADARY